MLLPVLIDDHFQMPIIKKKEYMLFLTYNDRVGGGLIIFYHDVDTRNPAGGIYMYARLTITSFNNAICRKIENIFIYHDIFTNTIKRHVTFDGISDIVTVNICRIAY